MLKLILILIISSVYLIGSALDNEIINLPTKKILKDDKNNNMFELDFKNMKALVIENNVKNIATDNGIIVEASAWQDDNEYRFLLAKTDGSNINKQSKNFRKLISSEMKSTKYKVSLSMSENKIVLMNRNAICVVEDNKATLYKINLIKAIQKMYSNDYFSQESFLTNNDIGKITIVDDKIYFIFYDKFEGYLFEYDFISKKLTLINQKYQKSIENYKIVDYKHHDGKLFILAHGADMVHANLFGYIMNGDFKILHFYSNISKKTKYLDGQEEYFTSLYTFDDNMYLSGENGLYKYANEIKKINVQPMDNLLFMDDKLLLYMLEGNLFYMDKTKRKVNKIDIYGSIVDYSNEFE